MAALAALSIMLYKNLFGSLHLASSIRCADLSRISGNERQLADAIDFPELRRRYRDKIKSQLRYAKALAVAAPLLGLLGTVIGMLNTFEALSAKSSADTTQSVADGISIALTTTQAGLMIAIPALFLGEWIKRRARESELELFARHHDLDTSNPSS